MNNENNANFHHINIEELASSTVTEIKQDLSDNELNGINGGIKVLGPIKIDPLNPTSCQACCSGRDPRFDDKQAEYM